MKTISPVTNPLQKFSSCESNWHNAFHLVFLGCLTVSAWFCWGPYSGIRWDRISEAGLVMAAVQIGLYALRFLIKPAGWEPTAAWDGIFFSVNFSLCLIQLQSGLGYFWWVFWVFLGLMLVVLPKRLSLVIGVIVTFLYVPSQIGWGHVGTLSFSDAFNRFYPLAFPWVLGLLYRQLLDTNGERARLIEELQTAKKALETTRDRDIELATLRERERLARDLHDTLGHQLVTLTVQLEAAQRLLAVDPPRAASMLEETQKLSRSSMDDLRRALDNLRASGLGNRPLVAALQTLGTEAAQRFSLVADCKLDATADALPPAVAEVLWRVAQEGLTNVGKHAQARHVQMNLNLPPGEIILRVADDGVGLPAGAEDKPGHYGLRGLRERVEGLGGTFSLTTPKGGGAALEAHLPVIA